MEKNEANYREMVEELATYFKLENPSFDRSKFMKYCGWYNV